VTHSPWILRRQKRTFVAVERGDLNRAVAAIIRERRRELGLSQEELADRCHLDRTYISSIERGGRNLTLETLEKVIPHLGLSTAAFLNMTAAMLRCDGKDGSA
jgi:transcriptional regulator with XRE-family HTH domain